MKKLVFFVITCALFGCNNPSAQHNAQELGQPDTVASSRQVFQ